MEAAGLAVSIVGVTELCIKQGSELLKRYRSYRNADLEIRELVLVVEDHWLKMQEQFKLLRQVWNLFEPTYQVHLQSLLQVLDGKLQQAIVAINSILDNKILEPSIITLTFKDGNVNRARYALRVKDSLKKTTAELKKWHEMFNSWWLLFSLNPSSRIDNELMTAPRTVANGSLNPVFTFKGLRDRVQHASRSSGSSIFKPDSELLPNRQPIDLMSTRIAWTRSDNSLVLVDTIRCRSGDDFHQVSSDVCDLATVLASGDAFECGLLPCQGVIKRMENASDPFQRSVSFEFLFSVPRNQLSDTDQPQGLRSVLISPIDLPLNERFQLATLLARSVMYVHTCNFVHKNIRPETIVCLQSRGYGEGGLLLGKPYLMGFEKFRPAAGKTSHRSDNFWESNLYRHPQRQGKRPEEDYTMQHDIYSVGVVLLEVGLWKSFVIPPSHPQIGGKGSDNLTPREPAPHEVLGIGSLLQMSDQRKAAGFIKDRLVSLAEEKLPFRMGRRYTDIVVECLRCLDEGSGFGDKEELGGRDGIGVGVRFIEKVLYETFF
ncbi:MAG: hypothetical protein Q9190_002528 [Brigantiaea leucoxantha]